MYFQRIKYRDGEFVLRFEIIESDAAGGKCRLAKRSQGHILDFLRHRLLLLTEQCFFPGTKPIGGRINQLTSPINKYPVEILKPLYNLVSQFITDRLNSDKIQSFGQICESVREEKVGRSRDRRERIISCRKPRL